MSEVKQEGDFKIKSKPKKPKNLGKKNEITRVEIPNETPKDQGEVIPEVTKVEIKTTPNADTEQETTNVVTDEPTPIVQEVVEEIPQQQSSVQNEVAEITEITEEVQDLEQELGEALDSQEKSGAKLPENIEKLVSFMEETGGTLEDYVRLNRDYSNVNESALLKEYYKKTKPHLDDEDINIILEDFSYDEELDDEREIRKAKIAYKEEIAKAKNFLEETKSKYYDEIKLRPGVTQDQQKAMDFFNRYNEEQETAKQKHQEFLQKTKNLLNNDFKGFDFSVGEKKFRYGVKNVDNVVKEQSDISTFIGRFLDKNGNISDTKGYHKALYAARNADTIAQHFYEQGKADAIKEVAAKSKNITTEPRQNASGNVFVNGIKVKAISGLDSSKLKIKTRKFN
jgi:uncharacterized protein (DUF2164 family)